MNDITIKVKMAYEECCKCGVVFGIPQSLKDRLLSTKDFFYCPNGHAQQYVGEADRTKANRLEKELEEIKRWQQYYEHAFYEEQDEHEATKNSLRATKAAKTRLKNRIKNGVCPCCHRHFDNLQRHIKTKHPGYEEEEREQNEQTTD